MIVFKAGIDSVDIYDIIWKEAYIDKLEWKHGVNTEEVEQVLFGEPFVRRGNKGSIQGEDLYIAYGQTATGRYLIVFFVFKPKQNAALPISSRDMTPAERRYYASQKK
ncbi:MAG: BrnT family toxin [Caldilineaceae bacterium]